MFGYLYPTAEHTIAGCIAGSVAGRQYSVSIRHTVHVCAGYERGGFMCEICANDTVASHSVVKGLTLASAFYKIIKWVSF